MRASSSLASASAAAVWISREASAAALVKYSASVQMRCASLDSLAPATAAAFAAESAACCAIAASFTVAASISAVDTCWFPIVARLPT